MIVLKGPQDQLLGALQSVAGIVERRHTLPILANVLISKNGGQVELTIREVAGEGADRRLVFRSSSPSRRTMIGFPDPYAGEIWEVDGDQLQVRGRVCMYLCLEAMASRALAGHPHHGGGR